MQQISIVGHSRKYIGLSSEALMSSKLKPAKLACPPNSNVDKCALVKSVEPLQIPRDLSVPDTIIDDTKMGSRSA